MKICEAEKYFEDLLWHSHSHVTFVRPRIAPERSPYVFTTSTAHPTNPTGILSFPSINKILAKAENNIHRQTGSRIFRSSRVTNSRKNKISKPQAKDMATSVSHSLPVSIVQRIFLTN